MDIKLPPKPWYVKYRLAIALGIALTALMAYTITLLLSPRTVYLSADRMKAVTAAEKSLANAIKIMLGINPAVHLVPPKTIARSEGKAVRVKDKRKLHD